MTSRPHRLLIVGLLAVLPACLTPSAHAGDCVIASWDAPSLDRWNYPFNLTPGTKPDAKVFGAYGESGLSPDFDNRDGQMTFGFDTSDQITAGLPSSHYEIITATVTIMVESEDTFAYDPTVDPWASYLDESDPMYESDPDPGQPVELFGVGYRDGFSALTWQEDSPYSGTSAAGKFTRSAWPLAFDASHAPYDVSNTVDQQVDAVPFAIGQTSLAPGASVPQLTTMTFEVNVADPGIQQYLRDSLSEGRAMFSIASIFPAAQQVGGSFPEFFTKEAPAVEFDLADAATLTLDVRVGRIGDVDGSGTVDVNDLLDVLTAWGACGAGPCDEDTNCDGIVDVSDLLNVLGDWG